MDFLEEIEPHKERLDHYRKSGNYSGDVNSLRDLARIYMKYIYKGKGDVKANLTCSQCKAKMMQRILSHYNGSSQPELDYDNLKMGTLKSLASNKGMNTYKKKKTDIIQWLKENS